MSRGSTVGGQVVEGAEEGTESGAACCDETEAWLDRRPDRYVSVSVSTCWVGNKGGVVRCCEEEVIGYC